jgi:hypothetical protein
MTGKSWERVKEILHQPCNSTQSSAPDSSMKPASSDVRAAR